MEFGLDELRTGLRPSLSRLELSRHVEIARTYSNLVADLGPVWNLDRTSLRPGSSRFENLLSLSPWQNGELL